MNNPLISIIIPIYNVESYLKECLDSVVNQSYANLDIILIDDGSTDKSLDIALQYLRKDERIFLISKENGGLSSARNMGLEFLKGTKLRSFFEEEQDILSFTSTHSFEKNTKIIKKEYIKSNFTLIEERYIKTKIENINDFIIQELPDCIIHFLDSDDYFLKDCIKLCAKEMLDKDLDICAHGFSEYNEEKCDFVNNPCTDLLQKSHKVFFDKALNLLKENHFLHFYFTWQGSFKSHILNQYNLRFTHGIYHEDHDFGTILFCLASKIFYIKQSLLIYRIRQGSITNFYNKKMPNILPKYLNPLRKYFNDYIKLREYFKIYCDIVIAKRIQNFNKSINDAFLKKSVKIYCMPYFDIKIDKDPLNLNKEIKFFIKNLYFYKLYRNIRMYVRHPKKIFRIKDE
ncbi:glycosyltransferase [Campylobacter hepaticus]|uniref:Glycosyltransferase family 2 protein n=14 Tax=Campylobacter hepaticus TaxID=1813019 RepID=A0AAD0W1F7_9BACT|nr:glycosyltransferase family 2 protein [Campylobacter hepaticus]AXP08380.1 glycosyltransferase family 2 protein [Campylobacter hepaticus]MCZ0772205.1 glycosyltransferase [Campylobacter hepaticus]MCZ0773674.1 glycosyltransferase [Campylobacter hepaticus]MCZ0774925.1 glycosyltransferase [Campylobacter hepaticus]MDX2333304.1 glycosyltransferase [Campylobacter hepaticus]